MSKEFEEIVLKKLEKLDTLEAKFNNLETEVGNLNSEVGGLKTEVGNLNSEVGGLKTEVGNLNAEVGSIKTELKDTNKRLGNLEIEVKDTGEVVNFLNQNFTKFDYEINRKIDTLFDAITANNEKHDLFEKSIVSLNTKTFNHDIRISVLEDYNKNSKIFATG